MLPSFRRTSPAALPKAGTPRCYERLTATDVDLGYVLEHGELPSWHPQQRSIWRLRRSPLLWWGRWRLRKAQMLQNGSGRFEVGNHGQDLAFPSASGAPEQLKPEGSFQQLRPRNSPALPPRPRSRASFGLSRTSTVVAAAAGVAGCCSTRGHRHHLPTPPGVGRKDPMIANVMGARRGNQRHQPADKGQRREEETTCPIRPGLSSTIPSSRQRTRAGTTGGRST